MELFLGLPARSQHGATEDAASSAYPVERQSVGQHYPPATSTKVNPWEPQAADIKSRKVSDSEEPTQNLPPDTLPCHNITLTLSNSGIS